MMHRTITGGLCALALLLGSTGLASAVTIIRGNDTDPATLDHHKTSTVAESRILRDLYEGLVTLDAAGEMIPGVAESWEVSDDGADLHVQPAPGRQMVERRPGDRRRLRLRLPAHHGSGDRRRLRLDPLPDQECREGRPRAS